jgi:hypothetical protein
MSTVKPESKMRTLAAAMQATIDDMRRSLTQNPTPKRMCQYRSRVHDSNNLERTQSALLALADLHEADCVPAELREPARASTWPSLIRFRSCPGPTALIASVVTGIPGTKQSGDKYSAFALAERCQRFGVTPQQQQELWHKVLKHVSLTPKFVRALLDQIGGAAQKPGAVDLLFAMPASLEHALGEFKERARQLRRAQLGIEYLLVCKDSGVLDEFPGLREILNSHGGEILEKIKAKTTSDGEVLGELCTAA